MGDRKPKLLGTKLRYIRKYFGLDQDEMLGEVRTEEYNDRSAISRFESGKVKPSLEVLLNYKHFVMRQGTFRISTDILLEDDVNLDFPE